MGKISTDYFRKKFGADIITEFGERLAALQKDGMLSFNREEVNLTQKGLLRVDLLLHQFYAPQYRNARYT
jgi:oxygen-independent coproporphyrinogen-3 oxidase